jgi:malonyl-CoA O-methyltransferase
MPLAINKTFNRAFAADASATFARFNELLVQGDKRAAELREQVSAWPKSAMNEQWQAALALLARLDNRPALTALAQPCLHLLAECDALVPAAAAPALAQLNLGAQVRVLPHLGHALHWSDPAQVVAAITEFLAKQVRPATSVAIAKQKIAQSFSRAAPTYDAAASLQRAVGEQLLSYLPAPAQQEVVLDVGSGTGVFTRRLQQQYPAAQVVGVDIAQGMLQFARQQSPAALQWVGGDAEHLPFASGSVDLVFSSLAIQWCHQLSPLLAELQRVLRDGGCLLIASLGPRTLHELKQAWREVDDFVHVNAFQPASALLAAAQEAGLEAQLLSEERVLHFANLGTLTSELRALGAHNMNVGQARGFAGRGRVRALTAAYEAQRQAQGLPATYEVLYLIASKPLANR